MNLFNFGNKQRLHTQLIGQTTGQELFKVNEYNDRKKITTGIIIYNLILGTIFYFSFKDIPTKIFIFLILTMIGTLIWGFFNFKQQRRLREGLY